MAAKYAQLKTFGNETEQDFYNLLAINTLVRTLERNQPIIKTVKVPVSQEGQTVDISSLKKQNNVLILDSKDEFTCEKIEVSPCLSDDELQKIVEHLKSMCSLCNC